MSKDATAPSSLYLRQEITLPDAVAIVVGTTIGSGIFLLPSFIAAQLSSLGAVLVVWIAGGILTICGALSLAELGSMFPGSGGVCVYLQRAYGPLPAFLYAWSLLLMIHSGSIAALAVAFGLYAGQILPLSPLQEKLLSAACILALTSISCLGIRGGKLLQNAVATAKIAGLAAIIVLACARGSRPIHLFQVAGSNANLFSLGGFGVALIAVLWAYEGWHVISFVAGEMKKPKLDLPRSLFYGTTIVMLIYVIANLGYYHVLTHSEIQDSNAVAALTMRRLFGPVAGASISVLIVVSLLGSLNGLVITGPRVYYAMARSDHSPRAFSLIDERYRTPMLALIIQGMWAAVLAVSGTYQQLFTDVIFTAWIFYGLAVAGVLVLRRTQPRLQRPFMMPGYPWVPILFCTAALGLVLSTVLGSPGGASIGVGFILAGVPMYFILARRHRRAAT